MDQQDAGEHDVEGPAGNLFRRLDVQLVEGEGAAGGRPQHVKRFATEGPVHIDARHASRRAGDLPHEAHRLARPATDVQA